jgi:hypothetical protein
MLRWISNWFDKKPPTRKIDIRFNGKVVSVTAVGIRGLFLCGRLPTSDGSSSSDVLFSIQSAIDAEQFRRIWRDLGGSSLKWPDGTPIILPEPCKPE